MKFEVPVVVEADRQWCTVMEGWLIYEMALEHSKEISQLFIKRSDAKTDQWRFYVPKSQTTY